MTIVNNHDSSATFDSTITTTGAAASSRHHHHNYSDAAATDDSDATSTNAGTGDAVNDPTALSGGSDPANPPVLGGAGISVDAVGSAVAIDPRSP